MKIEKVFGKPRASQDDGTHWLTISDLMSGLMMIFLFIAISYMRYVQVERDRIKDVVVVANDTQVAIYEALEAEFKPDLEKWKAELDRQSMTVRFKEPDVLFATNSDQLQDRFKDILADFFPRYVRRLKQFHESIDEIRIEGHTSSEWRANVSPEQAYFLNMDLSQRRTQAVLQYCFKLADTADYPWLKKHFAGVGLSSARVIQQANGKENEVASRRVEFTVKTNFERRMIQAILPEGG